MNRRKFFRAAASFVAGCAIGLGMRPKIEPVPKWDGVIIGIQIDHITDDGLWIGYDGMRSLIEYKCVDGKWRLIHPKHEPTRKA